jgi:hypothetical protein
MSLPEWKGELHECNMVLFSKGDVLEFDLEDFICTQKAQKSNGIDSLESLALGATTPCMFFFFQPSRRVVVVVIESSKVTLGDKINQ